MIPRRIPFMAYQKAVYNLLKNGQTTSVYDDVPSDGEKPYITLEHFTAKANGGKLEPITNVSLTLHVWSDYEGKSEVNGIIDDICTLYSCFDIDMSEDGFAVLSKDVDFVEVLPEEVTGYHGVVTVTATIQDKGKE